MASRQGGDYEDNPFAADHVDSMVMAAPLEVEDYFQCNIDSLCNAMLLSIWSDM